jgi:hypothetical protein
LHISAASNRSTEPFCGFLNGRKSRDKFQRVIGTGNLPTRLLQETLLETSEYFCALAKSLPAEKVLMCEKSSGKSSQ